MFLPKTFSLPPHSILRLLPFCFSRFSTFAWGIQSPWCFQPILTLGTMLLIDKSEQIFFYLPALSSVFFCFPFLNSLFFSLLCIFLSLFSLFYLVSVSPYFLSSLEVHKVAKAEPKQREICISQARVMQRATLQLLLPVLGRMMQVCFRDTALIKFVKSTLNKNK